MKVSKNRRELAPSQPEISLESNSVTFRDKLSLPYSSSISPIPKIAAKTPLLPSIGTGPLNLRLAASALMPQFKEGKTSHECRENPNYLDVDSTHSYIQHTWSVFSNLNDGQRDQLLKGLISRCSSKQIQLICTCLNLKAVNTNNLPGSRPDFKIVPGDVYGKYLVAHSKKQIKPASATEEAIVNDPYVTMAKVMSSSATNSVDSGFLNTNIYIKLINNAIDPDTIIKQLAKSGPEGMKFLMHFLSERCKKLQNILSTIHEIALEIDSEKASEKLFQCIIDSTDAKYGTVYFTTSQNSKLTIHNSNWPEARNEAFSDQIFGIKTILKGEIQNVCNVKSSDGVINKLIILVYTCNGGILLWF